MRRVLWHALIDTAMNLHGIKKYACLIHEKRHQNVVPLTDKIKDYVYKIEQYKVLTIKSC